MFFFFFVYPPKIGGGETLVKQIVIFAPICPILRHAEFLSKSSESLVFTVVCVFFLCFHPPEKVIRLGLSEKRVKRR
jgi:hypothetical protein